MRRGFTVIEVVVGLAIAGLALLAAGRIFGEAGARAGQIERALAASSDRSVARLWLRSAFGSLEVGLTDDDSFRGLPDRVEFASRLMVPSGWAERRRVSLGLRHDTLAAVVGGRDTTVLETGVDALDVHYLLTGGERSEWLRGWQSPATAPVAIRLILWHRTPRVGSDTLVYLVGSRG